MMGRLARTLATLGAAMLVNGCMLDRSAIVVPHDAGPDGHVAPECERDDDCDDGLFCNGFELCSAGACAPGAPPACADAIECTLEICDEAADECVRLPDHARCAGSELCSVVDGCVPREPCAADADCDDGFACNGEEGCIEGACAPSAPPSCADAIDCTVDACSEARGGCVNVPDDGACGGELVCDASAGCVPPTLCTSDAECDDGNFCDGAETCVDGRCAPGTAPDCTDSLSCTVDVCDELSDTCRNVPDHGACPIDQQCVLPGGCAPPTLCTSDAECDDGFFCNGAEVCASGRCAAGAAPDCADAVACTADVCDEAGERCRNLPDASACAVNEHCDAVLGCVPQCTADGDCDDGFFCNGAETCVSGGCTAGTPPACGDAVSCTLDACDETSDVCRHLADDGACAVNERCDAVLGCVPQCTTDGECDDGFFCNGAETCVSGGCVAGTPPACGDAVSCTLDACDETSDVCRHLADDGACAVNEHCDAVLGCVPQCSADPDCDDGLFCNGSETCVAGGCVAGTAPDCADGVACTVDLCDESGDRCVWAPDDALCDTNETCGATGCVLVGG